MSIPINLYVGQRYFLLQDFPDYSLNYEYLFNMEVHVGYQISDFRITIYWVHGQIFHNIKHYKILILIA